MRKFKLLFLLFIYFSCTVLYCTVQYLFFVYVCACFYWSTEPTPIFPVPSQQGKAKDNDASFCVRDTPEGIRLLIGDQEESSTQWDGVLDLSWGKEPRPFFRIDRIDVDEGVFVCVGVSVFV